MAGNIFGKMAADTLGISDIGKIIAPEDFNKVDADDYIMHEDGEKIYFVIKSKSDEYCFTNKGLLWVDGDMAMSKKRVVKRYDFRTANVHSVTLETAGAVDLDVEIKFCFGDKSFSIDVDKKQIEQLKDLYKALYEIGVNQATNNQLHKNGLDSLTMANQAVSKLHCDGDVSKEVQEITQFNYSWMLKMREMHSNRDFGKVFEKYINN